MGKKMKLPFLSNTKCNSKQAKSSWPWPSCHQPRTLSFRTDDSLFKTINSAYLDAIIEAETPESWFSNCSESASFSTASDDEYGQGADTVETVIRGLRSERLFFEPGETSSILEEAKPSDGSPFKESVVLSMESQDPHADFRKSMEEMVEAHGLKDWEDIEELLCWYLRANGKSNHGYIVGAFVDLLVGLAISSTNNCIPSCSNCSHSPSSPLSFYTSSSEDNSSTTTPCASSLEAEEEIDNGHCLSSLSGADQKEIIEDNKDDASSSLLDV
ncbi:transcription repressor OFP13-like [Durio zibethinus]|uniref:Transcription repressor n=1 Tax=Durio zibethinus TaxID=66656 RepID=A0A6P6AMG6_DURZI|nr:transcription repressor OFP13-like [Durio zibethinus]